MTPADLEYIGSRWLGYAYLLACTIGLVVSFLALTGVL